MKATSDILIFCPKAVGGRDAERGNRIDPSGQCGKEKGVGDMIAVEHLRKEFSYYKKATGIKGSLQNVFHRAGKTTTLKMLSGILYPTGGKVEIDGFIPWERNNEFKRRISIVMGQKNQLWWDLPASDSFYLNKCIFGVDDGTYRDVVTELAELLDVRELLNVQVRRLSLGERMKMELLAALIHQPDILFLDEPTIGLDILSQKKIREFLRIYNQQRKTTVIITSHYMADIEALCRRAVIINQGQLVYDGQLGDINRVLGARKLLSVKTSGEVNEKQWENFGRVREISAAGAVLEVPQEKVKAVLGAILSGLPVEDFTVTEIPIEESIARFYQKEVATI